MLGPVGVDVGPAGKVVGLDHVDEAAEVLDGGSGVRGGRGLDAGLGNPLGLGGEVDVDEDVGVEDVALAVDGVADGDADVVVEDGEALRVGVSWQFDLRGMIFWVRYVELTLVVNDIITGVESLSGSTNRVEHEGRVGDLAANDLMDVAVGGRVGPEIEGVGVEAGLVGVGVEVARHLVVGADEILDVRVLVEVLGEVVEGVVKNTVGDVVAELGALVLGVAVLGHSVLPAQTDLDVSAEIWSASGSLQSQ